MPYSIQIRFDSKTNNQVLKIAEKISSLGIENPFTIHKSTPHIALCVFEELDFQKSKTLIETFSFKKFLIKFSSIGTFSGKENVLFLSPLPNIELIKLQSEIQNIFKDNLTLFEYYDKNFWVPHATVSINIPDKIFNTAFKTFQENFSPFTATAIELSLTRFRPNQTLYSKYLEEE